MSQNQLGNFLRARREAVSPAEVGLPEGTRRRTPGLRRSELATIAGISVEYLTRLEQGRDRNPSIQVLAALAGALRLSAEERLQLSYSAKEACGGGLIACPAARAPARSVRPTVRALLDRLEPSPAVLVNRLNDVLAHTGGYERLVGPIGLLRAETPNLIRFTFTDPRARTAYPDWERIADDQVAGLNARPDNPDPHVADLVRELALVAGAAFTDRLDSAPAFAPRSGLQRLLHPEAGELRLAYETLDLPDADGQRLIVHLPADEVTAAALDDLTGRGPGGLRVVNG